MKLITAVRVLAGCSVVCSVAAMLALSVVGIRAQALTWGQLSLALILLTGATSVYLRLRARRQFVPARSRA